MLSKGLHPDPISFEAPWERRPGDFSSHPDLQLARGRAAGRPARVARARRRHHVTAPTGRPPGDHGEALHRTGDQRPLRRRPPVHGSAADLLPSKSAWPVQGKGRGLHRPTAAPNGFSFCGPRALSTSICRLAGPELPAAAAQLQAPSLAPNPSDSVRARTWSSPTSGPHGPRPKQARPRPSRATRSTTPCWPGRQSRVVLHCLPAHRGDEIIRQLSGPQSPLDEAETACTSKSRCSKSSSWAEKEFNREARRRSRRTETSFSFALREPSR